MTLAALVLSGLSLIAVLMIGWLTVKSGERSAQASVDAAEASKRAAEATERTVAASERTAVLVASSTRERRLGGVIDNLVRIRTLFNEQSDDGTSRVGTPAPNSKEALTRLSLSRELEGRLAPFGSEFGPESCLRLLATQTWDKETLEAAIQEAVEAIEAL